MKNINKSYMICVLPPAELGRGRATAPPAYFGGPAHNPAAPEPPASMSAGPGCWAVQQWLCLAGTAGRPLSGHNEQQPIGRS